MNYDKFSIWYKEVQDRTYIEAHRQTMLRGYEPSAIIAGGEYQYAFMRDYMGFQHTPNGEYLWRGIPLIRSGPVNGVKLVWGMESIELPPPPEEE